jgi:hypothetical protein
LLIILGKYSFRNIQGAPYALGPQGTALLRPMIAMPLVTLYPKLRHHDKFFNYFRISIKSFDDLLKIVKDSLEADQNVPYGRLT